MYVNVSMAYQDEVLLDRAAKILAESFSLIARANALQGEAKLRHDQRLRIAASIAEIIAKSEDRILSQCRHEESWIGSTRG
jgi:hypothetical protein